MSLAPVSGLWPGGSGSIVDWDSLSALQNLRIMQPGYLDAD